MTLNDASKAFLQHCRLERHLSLNTLAAYRQDIDELNRYFGSININKISGNALIDYVSFLSDQRSLSPATVKRRLACAKTFFRWLARTQILASNPFDGTEIRVRIPDRLPRCLATQEMARLTQAAESAPMLNKLAVFLLFATGMRVGELTAIRVKDVDLDRGMIRIVGKGNRQRQVVFHNKELWHMLRERIKMFHKIDDQIHLLTNAAGRTMTASSIRTQVKRLARDAGLTRNVTPHMLRHTTATELLEAGVDIRFVQRLLGHRSILTTQIYTHVSDVALKAAILGADLFGRLERSHDRTEVFANN